MSRFSEPLRRIILAGVIGSGLFAGAPLPAQQAERPSKAEAMAAMKKAAGFYHREVSSHGGYVYYYSLDLRQRWGEGQAAADTIFVQPPGTPTVGMAYLDAFAATHDPLYLDAASEACEALIYGQLESGGWTQVIHFGPAERLGKYRHGGGGKWNVSSLDDGQTQAALQLLIRADRALNFQNAAIHAASAYGLDALLAAQFANGAFPQVWTGPVEPQPVIEARLPDYDWKTEGRIKEYWNYYTLNDNLAGTVCDTLILAHQVYGQERYKAAVQKLGDFLILAQLPVPQPGWCQQYNYQMLPIWARKFEPPAVAGWESQDVLETLLKISEYTGREKYREPIPRALAYLQRSLLPDGRLARFYEFGSNKPLYMNARYQLTYDDSQAPSHYGWKQLARLAALEQTYQRMADDPDPATDDPPRISPEEVRRILKALDESGRWISVYGGERLVGQPKFPAAFPYISSAVFSQNLGLLSAYVTSH